MRTVRHIRCNKGLLYLSQSIYVINIMGNTDKSEYIWYLGSFDNDGLSLATSIGDRNMDTDSKCQLKVIGVDLYE